MSASVADLLPTQYTSVQCAGTYRSPVLCSR